VAQVHIHILPRFKGDFARNDEVYERLEPKKFPPAPASAPAPSTAASSSSAWPLPSPQTSNDSKTQAAPAAAANSAHPTHTHMDEEDDRKPRSAEVMAAEALRFRNAMKLLDEQHK
jgi:hypothetical protein